MALKLKRDDQYGNGGIEYWKIVQTNINWLNNTSHVVLAGFLNQQTREDGKQPMQLENFDWSGDDFPFSIEEMNKLDNNVVKIAYEKIVESKLDEENKETNIWVNATSI